MCQEQFRKDLEEISIDGIVKTTKIALYMSYRANCERQRGAKNVESGHKKESC